VTPYDYYMVRRGINGDRFPPMNKLAFYIRFILALE
jgi:hypothetical protein